MNRTEAAAVLGVAQSASRAEIQSAFRAHARLLHPDRLETAPDEDRATASTAMQRLILARAVLLHSDNRPTSPRADDRASETSPTPETRSRSPRERAERPTGQQRTSVPRPDSLSTAAPKPAPPDASWIIGVSRVLFGAAAVSVLLALFGPPQFLGPMGATFWVLLLLAWIAQSIGRTREQSQRQQDHKSKSTRGAAPRGNERWQDNRERDARGDAGVRGKSTSSDSATYRMGHDIPTDYGDLRHWGDAHVNLEPDGQIRLDVQTRNVEHAYSRVVAADAIRIVACLSAWVSSLGQAARGETGVALETLLNDLDRTIEEIIESRSGEGLTLRYPARLPNVKQAISASTSIYFTPDSELLSLWNGLQTSKSDTTTLRKFACRLLDVALHDMGIANARDVLWIGCAAVSAAVRNDPSLPADALAEATLVANVYRFAEEWLQEQDDDRNGSESAQPSNLHENEPQPRDDEAAAYEPDDNGTSGDIEEAERDGEFAEVVDRSPAIVWGTGSWIYPAGAKVRGTALLYREGIEVELPEDAVLQFTWSMMSGWQELGGTYPMTIFSLGLRIEITTEVSDL